MAKFVLVKYPESNLDLMSPEDPFPESGDIVTTEEGKAVAHRIGEVLATKFRGRYYVRSGPAPRCAEPAQIIGDLLGLRAIIDERLDERHIVKSSEKITVGEFRQRQERGFLDPSRICAREQESPFMHRLRVESWLAETLGNIKQEEIFIIVGHGSVVEHLHSSLSWKPAGAMEASFTFCAPGNAHLWSDVLLPDSRRIWCCLGTNIDLTSVDASKRPLRGVDDLNGLAIDLASDPRFEHLAEKAGEQISMIGEGKYYIR